MLAMLIGALAVFSLVFASLSNVITLSVSMIGYTADINAGRYLFPMLLAWFATNMTVFFEALPSSTSDPNTGEN
jgi:hypothetical protein